MNLPTKADLDGLRKMARGGFEDFGELLDAYDHLARLLLGTYKVWGPSTCSCGICGASYGTAHKGIVHTSDCPIPALEEKVTP